MISLRQAEQQQTRPTQTFQPATQPVAKPTAQPTNHTRTVTAPMANFTRAATGGLGKIGDALMMPSTAFGGFLQGTRKSAERNAPLVKAGKKNIFSAVGEDLYSGAKNIKTGVNKKITPGQYLTEDVLKEKDAKKKFAISLATDLVADPLNAVGGLPFKLATKLKPAVQAAGKTKIIQKATDYAKKTPLIYKPIETVANPYFRNQKAGKIIEQSKETINNQKQTLFREISQASKGLDSKKQVLIGKVLEGKVDASTVEPRIARIANYFREVGEKVGRELVDEGQLNAESYERLKGKYMHHFWKNASEGKDVYAGISDVPKIDQSILKHRKGAEGYVEEFAAPTFKGLGTGMQDVEAARMYKKLATEFGVDANDGEKVMDAVSKGFQAGDDLSKVKGGQIMKGKLLPKEVVEYIKRNRKSDSNIGIKTYDKALSLWKAGKTIYNPAYHARNVISNTMLAEMQTGQGLLATGAGFAKSAYKLTGKGNQKYVTEATDIGLIKKKAFSEAIDELSEPFQKEGLSRVTDSVSKLTQKGSKIEGAKRLATIPHDAAAYAQQKSEDIAKLAVFSVYRKRGFSPSVAKQKAEEAIFSPYKISASERKLLTRAIPFYSFIRQSAPFAAKTLVKHPDRLAKYPKIEHNVEQVTKDDKPNEKNMPDYMKGMVRTPLKNEKGENKYLNTKYLYPYGGFVDEETGSANPLDGIGITPFLEEPYSQKFNKDSYFGTPIAREGQSEEDQKKARIEHIANTFLPAPYRSTKGKIIPAVEGRADYQGRDRNLPDTLLGELAGIKTYPYSSKQGAKNKSYLQYKINEDFKSEKNRILRDQSKTPLERTKELKAVMKRRQERLAEL